MTFRDSLALLGTILLVIGIGLESVSAALIVLGVLLLATGLWSHHVDSQPSVSSRNVESLAGDDGD